jgi:hypothetical protein
MRPVAASEPLPQAPGPAWALELGSASAWTPKPGAESAWVLEPGLQSAWVLEPGSEAAWVLEPAAGSRRHLSAAGEAPAQAAGLSPPGPAYRRYW